MFNGFFIDDSPRDANLYSGLLSEKNSLSIRPLKLEDITVLGKKIISSSPDIVAIDFRLDENISDSPDAIGLYKGSTLSQLLRDWTLDLPAQDFPIVLVSAETKMRSYHLRDQGVQSQFDLTYSKEQLSDRNHEPRRQLLALCKGYVEIKKVWKSLNFGSLLNLDPEEFDSIKTQGLNKGFATVVSPSGLSRFILRNLIERTGPLYDLYDLAAVLGISQESLKLVVDTEHIRKLQYEGIFNDGWSRWWSHRVDDWTSEQFATPATTLPGSERAKQLTKILGRKVNPAKSTWNGSPDELFAVSCVCCHNPTELRHSLTVFDGARPDFIRSRRVCWDCIQSDRPSSLGIQIDDFDQRLVKRIQALEKGADFE